MDSEPVFPQASDLKNQARIAWKNCSKPFRMGPFSVTI